MKLLSSDSFTEQMIYRAVMLTNCGLPRLMKSWQHPPTMKTIAPRPTLTTHHIAKRIGLCWPRYLNDVTTCHLGENTNSSHSVLSLRSRLPGPGHSLWLHGRAKSRAVKEAVVVTRSPHIPFRSCRSFALFPGTRGETRETQTMKNVCRIGLLYITDQRRRCSRHETHDHYWHGTGQHNWLPVRTMQQKHLFSNPPD